MEAKHSIGAVPHQRKSKCIQASFRAVAHILNIEVPSFNREPLNFKIEAQNLVVEALRVINVAWFSTLLIGDDNSSQAYPFSDTCAASFFVMGRTISTNSPPRGAFEADTVPP